MTIKEMLISQPATREEVMGTGKIFSLEINYLNLIKALGKPHTIGSLDDKVKVEWAFKICDGVVVTIHDYKSEVKPSINRKWSVGGRGNEELIKNWINIVLADYMYNIKK